MHTPRASSRSLGGNQQLPPSTPTGVRTVEEKKELSKLNKRLEFYILQQREKDAEFEHLRQELQAFQALHLRDLEREKKQHQERVYDLSNQRKLAEKDLQAKSLELER